MQITNKLSSGCVRMHALPCMTLCDHKDGSPTGFCVYGSFQARLLEWFAISSSRRFSWLTDQNVSHIYIGRWIPHHWVTWKALVPHKKSPQIWKLETHLLSPRFCRSGDKQTLSETSASGSLTKLQPRCQMESHLKVWLGKVFGRI